MICYFLRFIALALCATAAHATSLPVPNTEYSAIRQIEMAQGSFVQTIYHSFGKERAETTMQDMSMVFIQRPDKNIAWQIMPMNNMYMEIGLKKAGEMSGKIPDDATIEKVGSETVDGRATTKYKMLMKDKSAGGFIWLTEENIALKMDFVSKNGKKNDRVKMTLKQLKVEPQDAQLFELPAGYSKMPAMGNFMSR